MCSSPKKFRQKSKLGFTKLVCPVIICLAICVNHSHQENNLSIDRIKDGEHGHGNSSIHDVEHLAASSSKIGECFLDLFLITFISKHQK